MAGLAIVVPLAAYGASEVYDKIVLEHAVNAWNYSNGRIITLEKEISLERKNEVDNFCFLVEVKKEQGLSISYESIPRYETECLGL